MTCGVLEKLGVNLVYHESDETQLKFNPVGAYEINGNNKIGHAVNKGIEEGLSPNDLVIALGQTMRDVIWSMKKPESEFWGFKAPTIFGLDVFYRVFPNLHVVFVSRDLVQQSKSFLELRGEGNLLSIMEEVAAGYGKMFAEIKNNLHIPMVTISYDDLKHLPKKEMERLCNFLGISPSEDQLSKAEQFINPQIRTWLNK
jgi:hypothetical protein